MKIEKTYRIQQGRKYILVSKNEYYLSDDENVDDSNKLPIKMTINTSFQRTKMLLSNQDAFDLIEALQGITQEENKPIIKN